MVKITPAFHVTVRTFLDVPTQSGGPTLSDGLNGFTMALRQSAGARETVETLLEDRLQRQRHDPSQMHQHRFPRVAGLFNVELDAAQLHQPGF